MVRSETLGQACQIVYQGLPCQYHNTTPAPLPLPQPIIMGLANDWPHLIVERVGAQYRMGRLPNNLT